MALDRAGRAAGWRDDDLQAAWQQAARASSQRQWAPALRLVGIDDASRMAAAGTTAERVRARLGGLALPSGGGPPVRRLASTCR